MRVAGPGHTDVWCCGTGASWGQIAVAWARRRMGLAGWGSTRLIVNVTRASRLLRTTVVHRSRRGGLACLACPACPALSCMSSCMSLHLAQRQSVQKAPQAEAGWKLAWPHSCPSLSCGRCLGLPCRHAAILTTTMPPPCRFCLPALTASSHR